jgi:hypothetical protein
VVFPLIAADSPAVSSALRRALDDAMWAGDVGRLHELAPCRCCCVEHTSVNCVARVWDGCRGGYDGEVTDEDVESWVRHYRQAHGMTRAEFFGGEG